MGFLKDRKERKEREEQEAAAARAAAARREAAERWTAERADLLSLIEAARTFRGFSRGELDGISLQLKKDEEVFGVLEGAALIEPRRDPGTYQGGTSGFSFRIAKGVSYRVGQQRGTYVQGAEHPTAIDTGVVTITDQRVVFQGSKQAREWAYSKLIGMTHDDDSPWTAIQVSNRQKVSGFLYDEANAENIRFRLALAVALFNDSVEDLARDLEEQLLEHDGERPGAIGGGETPELPSQD